MQDPRIEHLAGILVGHSVDVQSGETVLICSNELARPLVEAVYKEVLIKGAHPVLKINFSTLAPLYYQHAAEEQLDKLLEIEELIYKHAGVLINIDAPGNVKDLSTVDPERLTRRARAMQPIKELIIADKLRWVLCHYPTQALAQEAEMSLLEYEKFLFGATNIDWPEQSRFQDRIKKIFDAGSRVRIAGPGTDLEFSIAGREGIKCDGHRNMPDGEVFYAPVEDSAEGYITYDFPAIYYGKEVDGVYLEFSKGRVVKASAEKNQSFLEKVLDTDPGARYIGEFGIGVNYGITRFTKDILFDEKIGGTVHLALGSAYPESGGKNISAIHWDMIKDLRSGGTIRLDGEEVQKNGKFI